MDYSQAKTLHAGARNKETGRLIANNTRIVARDNGAYAVRLHDTDVLTFSPDGSVTYNSGGWRTVTTKARMNEYGPARIWSNRGTWHIAVNGAESRVYAEDCRVKGGRIIGAAKDDTAEQKLRARVGAYVKAYMALLNARKMPAPSNGDCWGCCMRTDKGERPLGGANHIKDHIKEKYYVPSLVWTAMESTGASQAEKMTVHGLQTGGKTWPGAENPKDWINKQIARHLRRYILRELGLVS